MKQLHLDKTEVDYRTFVKRNARETDFSNLVVDDTLCFHEGKPIILYATLPHNLTHNVRVACTKLRYETSERTGGLKTTSRIFGYSPRNTIRKDFCSATSTAHEHPKEHAVICDFGRHLAALYQEHFPEVYSAHTATTREKMLHEWQIPRTPFTSGIVNKNNPLKYHFDAGNISGVLSNMIVFKSGVSGGHLSCPEYDTGFEVADNTAILFDGQKILHGVTPIKRNHSRAYRYSIVYYTLKEMWNCLPLTEEIARARNVMSERATRRALGEVHPSVAKFVEKNNPTPNTSGEGEGDGTETTQRPQKV